MKKKIRVLLARRFMSEDLDYLQSRIDPCVELIIPVEFTTNTLAEIAQKGIDAILGEPPCKEVLDKAVGLQLIQVPWTGIERLDLPLLRQYSFTVCNSHSNARVVAEYACSLLLSAAKWIPYHDRQLRQGKWCRPNLGDAGLFRPPESLHGKTVGIFGFGAIGSTLAQLLSGFAVDVQAVDIRPISTLPPHLSRLVSFDSMDEVIAVADFLVFTLPLTEKTRGMIRREHFERMKPSAFLVNVSRGEIIIEEDLYQALEQKRIAGAAIDTWYQYPSAAHPNVFPSKRFPFHMLDNLILSPHRAGFSRGELTHLNDAIENLNRLVSGMNLINVVDLSAGY